jgi:hypothetical protein
MGNYKAKVDNYVMAVQYNFRKAIDLPDWTWLPMFPAGNSNHGTSRVYDGNRYVYWVIQYGTTATTASTTALYRYDTWSSGWQFLATTTSGNQGIDIEYDPYRNVLYIIPGSSLTSWQVFNLNTTAVTIANVSCAAWALTAMTPVLPAANSAGGSITMPSDIGVPTIIDSGTADSVNNTTTTIDATTATGTFGPGMVGLQLHVLTGAQAGQLRTIASVTAPNVMTVSPALPGALAAGDTFQIELVNDIATGGSTTTVVDTTASWITNAYANMDVIIVSGTGSGQRRRIASNTATTLTLAAAVTGNPRTGAFTTAPDSTSTYRIVPSSDFLYYQPGGSSTTFYKIDVAQTTGIAWSSLTGVTGTIGGGGNTFYPAAYAPYQILAFRGNATATVYIYNIGTNAWAQITTYPASETFTTGAAATMISGKRKLIIQKEGQVRLYVIDLLTGLVDAGGTVPYAAPGTFDGKRAIVLTTADGAQFLYILRGGGQEFFRVPLEWL